MLAQLTNLYKYREAVRLLTWRELQVRYSNSVLGIVWSLLYPLMLTVFFSVAFTALNTSPVPNYPVFFLAALLPWNTFSASIIGATHAITSNSALVNRVAFPREIIPLAVTSANAISFLIALIPLVLLMLWYGVPFTLALLWLPVILAAQLFFTIGLGLLLAAFNVYLRDIQQFIEVFMLPWFFLTPIVYAPEALPAQLRSIVFALNPMANLVTLYRQIIYTGQTPDLQWLGLAALEGGVLLLVGLVIFSKLAPNFVDEL
jgi:ABC-type polysaccharide/polyol phosphate export permease